MGAFRRWAALTVACLSLFISTSAWAVDYFAESQPTRDKSVASAWVTGLPSGSNARVVRRFHGGGWEYVVRVEAVFSEAEAERAAALLAESSQGAVEVYRSDAGQATAVATLQPTARAEAEREGNGAAHTGANTEDPEVARILSKAIAAHGESGGGLAVLGTSRSLLFKYRRVLPDGPTVMNTYAARGGEVSLLTKIESGEGVSSHVWTESASSAAWLSMDTTQVPVAQDTARTLEVVARFAPENVLAFPFEFPGAAASRAEFRSLRRDGTARVDDRLCDVLRYGGSPTQTAFVLAIDQDRSLVRRVTFVREGGEITHEFSDWKEITKGVMIPRRVQTWKATALIDTIEVIDLDSAARLPEEWFRAP